MTPGFLRASDWTLLRARSNASVAMPSQTWLHRMCETGSIVWVEMSANGTGRMLASGPVAFSANPRLQVPRRPRVSQSLSGFSSTSSLVHRTRAWSLGGLSGPRRQVTRTPSACSPYEMTGACFSSR